MPDCIATPAERAVAVVLLTSPQPPDDMAAFPCERPDGGLNYHRANAVCEVCRVAGESQEKRKTG